MTAVSEAMGEDDSCGMGLDGRKDKRRGVSEGHPVDMYASSIWDLGIGCTVLVCCASEGFGCLYCYCTSGKMEGQVQEAETE